MQTQDDWLDSRYIGSCNDEGLAIPDTIKIARAYGLKTEVINNHSELYKIKEVLESDESIVCDVNISINQRITPKLMFGKELDEI